MNGTKFLSSLKDLNVPDIEHLSGDDFDYLFCDPENKSIGEFFEVFFANTSLKEKLSDDEILEYEELLGNGQILTGKHLDEMELHLEPFMAKLDPKSSSLDFIDDEDDIESLETQLETLEKKKDFLNLLKMTESQSLSKKRHRIQDLMRELERTKAIAESVANEHSNAITKLSTTVEKASSSFILFEEKDDEKANYISQLPIDKWQKKEEMFSNAVEAYVEKQFKEGVSTVAGQDDVSSYSIIDSGQLDLQLVRGPGQVEYLRNAKELNRVSKMLEICALESVVNEVEKTRCTVEMEEALKFMKMYKTKPTVPISLQSHIAELVEMKQALEQDYKFKIKFLEDQALKVAQLERMKTISGNYDVKLQRQEYFLGKQDTVIQFLLRQLSRYDFMKIILNIEKQNISSILLVLEKLNKWLSEKQKRFLQRMHYFNTTKKEIRMKEENGVIYEELVPIVKLLSSLDCNPKEKYLIQDVASLLKNLESSIKSSKDEAKLLVEKKTRNIMSMCNTCILLEECLFGKFSCLSTLPASWLPDSLITRHADTEQNLWDMQCEMIKVIKDYEEKKKVMKENPEMNDIFKWTNSVMQKH